MATLQIPANVMETPVQEGIGKNTEMDYRAAIAKKILTVQSDIGVLYKDGTNEKQQFSFVSYELVNSRLREVLPRIGLSLVPEITEITERDVPNSRGGLVTRTMIRGLLHVIDCDTGYRLSIGIAGADNDSTGKSLGKAFTEMVKRGEMKLFHVTTMDDKDPDGDTLAMDYPPQQQGQYQQVSQQGNYYPPQGQYQQRGY